MKPGVKTTEFWATLLVQVIGILALTGVLTPELADTFSEQGKVLIEAISQAGGAIMMAWSASGYAKSRGEAKRSEGK